MKKSLFLFSSLFFTMGFAQITNGLVMDVPFTYGNVYDQIGTNYGVNVGATLTQDRFGKENMALHFNGAEYVYFPDNMSTNLDNLDEMSISVWIKPDDAFSGMRAVVAKWNGVTNEQYGLFQDGTNAVYAVRNINNIGTTVGLPVSTGWYHVVFTLDKITNEQNLYVNNVLVSNYVPGGLYTNTTESTALSIGAQYNDVNGSGASPNRFFEGAIDDVQIFNRVLSVEEVDTLYGTAAPYCLDLNVEVIQVTNTASNTGAITFNVNGGHAPYIYNINAGPVNNMTSGKVCANESEGFLTSISAPATATFRSVNFASYGNPSGVCSEFIYANCHAPETMQAVEDSLIGNSAGTFMGNNATFGYDPCFGTGKNTRIMASYAEDVTLTNLVPGDYTIAVMDSMGCLNWTVVTVSDITAGMDEANLEFGIYPNPASNELYILTEDSFSFNIISVTGEIISSQQAKGKTLVDISVLSPGIYFIQTQNGQTKRFVKSH